MGIKKVGIKQLTEDRFVEIIQKYLMPSSPVRREELLKGRQGQLEMVRKTLLSPGRNVFIHGLRGVGKTSLAQTAANLYQRSDSEPVPVACERDSTFKQVIRNICSKLISESPIRNKVVKNGGVGFAAKGISAEWRKSIEEGRIPEPASVDEAITLVGFCSQQKGSTPVIVVDEFDRIEDIKERTKFGDFIKQVGDQGLAAKFIFCGVGESLEELLADHESAYRYFAGIGLDRLALDPCMEIIEQAADKVGVEVSRDISLRAAWISDGFPHFAHLIGEKLLWRAFEDEEVADSVTIAHFTGAIQDAVNDVERHLKALYDKATKKYGSDYEYVLWAAADHPDTDRRSADIWEAYQRITRDLREEPISRDSFNNRMNSLKKDTHGETLVGTRQGWYKFRNPMLRGYCRLKAHERGVELGREHCLEEEKQRGIRSTNFFSVIQSQ